MTWILYIILGVVAYYYFKEESKPGCGMITFILVLIVFLYLYSEIGMIGSSMVTLWVIGAIGCIVLLLRIFKG